MRLTVGKADILFVIWAILLLVATEVFLSIHRLTGAAICNATLAVGYSLKRIREKTGDGIELSIGADHKKSNIL